MILLKFLNTESILYLDIVYVFPVLCNVVYVKIVLTNGVCFLGTSWGMVISSFFPD